ncbi:MAG: DUF4097 family beta strand repeat-containing protein [Isosphaeraceae bacterium]
MTPNSTPRAGARLAIVALAGMLPMISGCSAILANAVQTRQVEQRSFTVQGQPEVVVETFNGAIRVEAVSGGKIDAMVTKTGAGRNQEAAESQLDQVKVDFAQEGDTVRIVARRSGPSLFGSSGAEIDLRLPPGSSLKLTTSNGELAAHGVQGGVVARSSNGQIDVIGGAGKLDLETSNGRIIVEASGAQLDARSSNGNVSFAGTLSKGSHRLHTSNGNIHLGLPSADSLQFAASTSNGTVKSGFEGLQTLQGKPGGHHWSASTASGDGAAIDVELETSNGNIRVEPLRPAEAPATR